MAKTRRVVFRGKLAAIYTTMGKQINEMTDYTPCSEENRVYYSDEEWVAADGNIVSSDVDRFPTGKIETKIGPGIKGWPAPTEGGKACNTDNFQRASALKDSAYQGRWSKGAKKRFNQCCDILFQAAIQTWEQHPSKEVKFPFQIAFLALTIHPAAGYISPKEAYKKLLKPFLRWLREKYKINGYVWVREYQKNGMIHYHIVYDKFILKTEIMRYWNHLMKKAGYLDKWKENNPGKDYPSTRVDKAQNPEQCAYYMAKYMSKAMKDNDKEEEDQESDGIDRSGKLWDTSTNLKEGKPFDIEYTPIVEKYFKEAIDLEKADIKINDFVNLVFAKHGNMLSLMPKNIQQDGLVHYRKILYKGTPLAPP